MAKFILTDAVVSINSVDLSDHAFSVELPEERERVDVSSFNSTGATSFLPGSKDQTITIGFLQDYASAKVHQTIQPLFANSTTFPFSIKPTSAAVSATNPRYWGTAAIFNYNGLAGGINSRSEITVELKPCDTTGFVWATS